jgi:hypothetical protein
MKMDEEIWYENVKDFVSITKMNKFFPTGDMSYEEKLNSFFRFSVYFGVAMYLIRKNTKVFFLPFFIGVLTLILYKLYENKAQKEQFGDQFDDTDYDDGTNECTKPTQLNPFMNVLMDEFASNANRGPACNSNRKDVKKDIENFFESDLYRSVDDVFNKNASFRQFYTNPVTTIPNDQEGFSKWLYFSEEKTCKEGNLLRCVR